MAVPIKESDIERGILDFLSYFPMSEVIKTAPSGFFDGGVMKKHRSPYVKKGLADIFFWYNSMFYAFEVKSEPEYKYVMKRYQWLLKQVPSTLNKKQKHLLDQILFLEGVKTAGFVGEFVCSVDMVRDIIEKKTNSK